jgi:hypothetical protein
MLACSPSEGGPIRDGFLDSDTPGDVADDGCTSTAPYCSTDRTQVLQCDPPSGEVTVLETCVAPEICIEGACVDVECTPHTSECVDETTVRICRSDGSGWEEHPCPESEICNEESGQCEPPCLLRVFVLIDQSGSMSDGTPPKWSQARDALHSVMTSETAEDVEFGFGAFPTDGNCATDSSLVIHPVPDATDVEVQSYFSTHSPGGNTPIVTALEFFASDTSANLNDPAYHNFILIVSDGMDTCYTDVDSCILGCMGSPTPLICIAECEAAAAEVTVPALRNATAHLLDDLEIRTFVVGFGSDASDAELSAIAEEGGTALGRWLSASDVSELTEAFQTILDEMWECDPVIH